MSLQIFAIYHLFTRCSIRKHHVQADNIPVFELPALTVTISKMAARCLWSILSFVRWSAETCGGITAHLGKQWAAVRTHWLLIREPPQKWLPLLCRLTCQGQAPAGASWPPTIRVLSGAMPQTGGKQAEFMTLLQVDDMNVLALNSVLIDLRGQRCYFVTVLSDQFDVQWNTFCFFLSFNELVRWY